jgi:hypothetical protein
MVRLTNFAAALLLSGCVQDLSAEDRVMRTIEATVVLPSGSAPLARYRRHYAWAKDKPGFVDAVYERGGRPKRLWLSWGEMPIVMHGGCGVITFTFDAKRRSFESVTCNGR